MNVTLPHPICYHFLLYNIPIKVKNYLIIQCLTDELHKQIDCSRRVIRCIQAVTDISSKPNSDLFIPPLALESVGSDSVTEHCIRYQNYIFPTGKRE